MIEVRQQGVIEAPVKTVWNLLADPNRHSEWWPSVIETDCEEIGVGCRYRAVTKGPLGRAEEHEIVIESLDDCREVSIYCEEVGVRNRFVLTEARGATFVDADFSIDPRTLGDRVFANTVGRRFLRRWLADSIDSLRRAAHGPR